MRDGPQKLLAVAAAAVALASSPGVPATAAGATQALPGASVNRFMLVTGEQILTRTDAAGREIIAAAPGRQPLLTYRLGASSYVVPLAAAPFVGHALDPLLFSSAGLRGVAAGSVPVVVRWHTRTRPSMPWLLDPHDISPGATAGRVTSASGAFLERALAAQPRSPQGAWTGSLRGVDGVRLDGAAVQPPPTPLFAMHTLTVRGIDASGAPDSGDQAVVLNADNAAKFVAGSFWYHGVLKLSVPSGHYSAVGTFFGFSATGASLRMTVVSFTVHGDATVTIDARASTSLVSVSTPRAAPDGAGSVEWQLASTTGGGASVGISWGIGAGAPPTNVYVNPARAPSVGSQSWLAAFHLDSPVQSVTPYTYDLAFESVGAILSDQHYVVARSQLAAVDSRYYSAVSGRASGELRLSFFPGQLFGVGIFDTFAAPFERTEYVLARPDLVWFQQVIESIPTFGGVFFDSGQVFQPNQSTTVDWGRGPVGPGAPMPSGAATGLQACPACMEAGTMELAIFPFGDNPPGHSAGPNLGSPDVSETDAFDLLRNGVSIASGQDPLGLVVPVPAGPATYHLGYSVSMSAPWWTLSTSTATQWTFRSPASTSGTPPPGWACFSGATSGCNVVGLMLPDYRVPVDLSNHVASGPTTWQLGIQHILDIPIAATRATVSVSFDGGVAWTAAQVVANPAGGFTVRYTNPSGASTASLRIHVVDADGGVLDQTILNAYAIS